MFHHSFLLDYTGSLVTSYRKFELHLKPTKQKASTIEEAAGLIKNNLQPTKKIHIEEANNKTTTGLSKMLKNLISEYQILLWF